MHFEICANFQLKMENFDSDLTQFTPNDPLFLKFTPIKAQFFGFHTYNDPLFSTKSYTECPLFSSSSRHVLVIFIFEYPRGPSLST